MTSDDNKGNDSASKSKASAGQQPEKTSNKPAGEADKRGTNSGLAYQKCRTWISKGTVCVARQLAPWLEKHAPLLLTIITFFYATFTLSYLLEAREQTALFRKEITVNTEPRPFIRNVDEGGRIERENSNIVIEAIVILTNCGKTRARNMSLSYRIRHGEKTVSKGVEGPYPYLYPGQIARWKIDTIRDQLSAEEMRRAEELREQGKALNAKYRGEPVLLYVDLTYEDEEENRIIVPYEFRYAGPGKGWVVPANEDGTEPR